MPIFSVYIPTYNRANYLKQAIDSVLDQTLTDFELIIIDDASTDGTKDLVAGYSDPRIKCFYNNQNLGCVASHNVALSHVKGDYIQPLDSDDILVSDNLEKKEKLFRKNKKVGLIYTDASLIDSDGNIIHKSYWENEGYRAYEGELSNKMLADCGCMMINPSYRKAVLDKVGKQNINLSPAHDLDYRLRIVAESQATYIPEVLYLYRIHDGGRHHSLGDERNYLERISIIENLARNYPKKINGYFKDICISNNLCQAGLFLGRKKKYPRARFFFQKALAQCPYNILALIWYLNTFMGVKMLWNYRSVKRFFVKILK